MVKLRPAAVYRNLLVFCVGLFLFYSFYRIVAYDEGPHETVRHRQKHLYLTVSKDRIESRFEKLAPKRILLWTPIFGTYPKTGMEDCKALADRCLVDHDRSLVSKADAIVFHSKDISDHPMPDSSLRKSFQRYVYMSMETPQNSGKYADPKDIRALPKNFFNWTATYLYSSDTIFKYGSFWIPSKVAEQKGLKVKSFHIDPARLKKTKSGIFGLISNCDTLNEREMAIAELAKYVNVTVGGACAKDEKLKNLCPKGNDCVLEYEKYPFFFAIENSNCKDYITEKYWNRVEMTSIPIVMKRSIYESSNLPQKSIISMDDFSSPHAMGKYLQYLEGNSTAYSEYFAWRRGDWTQAPWNAPGYRNGWCRLCEKLWEPNQTDSVVPDVYKWFEDESQCESKGDFVRKWIKTS